MKILIFEDEIYNFHLLRHMLEEMDSEYYILGPITSVQYGIDYLQLHQDIDIIIADIQLNDGLSFDALKYAPSDVPIIFTTAYDHHALRAFKFYSLSYLLKPIDEEELREALAKAKRLISSSADLSNNLDNPDSTTAVSSYRRRFLVKTGSGEKIILLDSVRCILSENKTTYIKMLDGTSYHIDMSLDTIAEQLDPQYFMRVNRKYIVPLNAVSGTQLLSGGRESLILHGDNPPEIIISREKKNLVNQWLGK